jgi:hypothetical protein
MSYLANAIDELLNEYNKNGAEIARTSGLNPAQISRWKNAEQMSIKPDCLNKLARAFSPSPKVHARLLSAHLRDQCSGPGAKYITINLLSNPIPAALTQLKPKLPPRIQQNLDIITKHISEHRLVRDIIEILANECK